MGIDKSKNLLAGLISGELLLPDTPQHIRALIAGFASGMFLDQLAEEYSMSEDEILHVLEHNLPCKVFEVNDAIRDVEQEASDRLLEAYRRRVHEWSKQNEGQPVANAAHALNLPESQVRALLGVRKKLHPAHRSSATNDNTRVVTASRLAEVSGLAKAAQLANESGRISAPGVVSHPFTASNNGYEPKKRAPKETSSEEFPEIPRPIPHEPEDIFVHAERDVSDLSNRELFDEWATGRWVASASQLEARTQFSWEELVNQFRQARAGAVRPGVTSRVALESSSRTPSEIRPDVISREQILETLNHRRESIEEAEKLLARLRSGSAGKSPVLTRDDHAVILYANGATLEEVGEQLGVTRERARQIISKQSPVPTADIRSALAKEKTYYATWRELCEIDVLEKWSKQNIGISIERAEELFHLPIAIIRKRLGVRHKFHPSERKAGQQQGYSDAELLSLLRQFHEETGSTVSAEFERWSTNQGGPTRQPVMIRFGTWNSALREAGIDDVEDIIRDRLYTDRDCWACVIEYLRRAESDYTFADFSEWVTADVYRPSPATVRNRLLVRWSDMVETGLAVLAGRQTKYGMRWATDVQRLRDWRELVTSRGGRHDNIIPVEVLCEAFEELGVPLTTVRYDEWSRATEKPCSAKLTRISGKKWNDLLIEAGVPLTPKQARRMADEAKKRATILPGG